MKNLLLALRTLKNYRFYSVINIVGLALSLASVMIIARYVYRELTVDTFNEKLDRIYATVVEYGSSTRQPALAYPSNPNKETTFIDPLTDPSILAATEVVFFPDDNFRLGDRGLNARVLVADSNFFKVFEYELISGDLNSVLRGKNSALITEQFAREQFGTGDPLGQLMIHSTGEQVVIQGVVRTPKTKSTIEFDVIVSSMLQFAWSKTGRGFVLVAPNTSLDELNERSSKFMESRYYGGVNTTALIRYQFVPLRGLGFRAELNPTDETNKIMWNIGDKGNLAVLSVVAFLVLLVGVFNFINIYTVLMLRRGREMGVKKVFGASVRSIVTSLYIENLVFVLLSVILGWGLTKLFAPVIQSTLSIPAAGDPLFDVLFSAAIIVVLPVLTCVAPYLKYRYAKPITSLREVSSARSSIVSRAVLMVGQYVVTVVMIVVSIYFVHQLNFMLNADLGFDTHNVIKTRLLPERNSFQLYYSDAEWDAQQAKIERNIQYVQTQMDASPLFVDWCYGELPLNTNSLTDFGTPFSYRGGEMKKLVTLSVSPTWLSMFGVDHIAGEQFSDSTSRWGQYKLIATPAALKYMGVEAYDGQALQPERRMWWSSDPASGDMSKNPPYEIIGVMENIQVSHLRMKADPVVYLYDTPNPEDDPILARMVDGREKEAIAYLADIYAQTGSGEFSYTMAQDEVRAMYNDDRRVARIYSTFAAVAILISSLGLFGLSLYDVQQRRREIALRRVNGARVGQIVGRLLRKYYILLAVAFVIAIPLSVWAIEWYMADFATRAPLSWWIFAVAAGVTACVSLLTLIYQTVRAAAENPIESLKTE